MVVEPPLASRRKIALRLGVSGDFASARRAQPAFSNRNGIEITSALLMPQATEGRAQNASPRLGHSGTIASN